MHTHIYMYIYMHRGCFLIAFWMAVAHDQAFLVCRGVSRWTLQVATGWSGAAGALGHSPFFPCLSNKKHVIMGI